MLSALNQQSLQQQQQQQQSAGSPTPSTPSRKNSAPLGHHHPMTLKNDLSLSTDMHTLSTLTPCTPVKPEPGMHVTHGFEPGGMVKSDHHRQQQQQQQQRRQAEHDSPDEEDDYMMEEDTPAHPLVSNPSEAMDSDQPTPASSLHPLPPLPSQHHPRQQPQPHHPNQLPSHPSISPQPDIVMTSSPGDDDACRNKSLYEEPSLDDDKHDKRSDRHLVIDTSSALHPSSKAPSSGLTVANVACPASRAGSHQPDDRASTTEPLLTPQTATTPTAGATAIMANAALNSAAGDHSGSTLPSAGPPSATTSSSRRPSLRTMTATLPRSALQEETIALFKQYRELIPCAKCFCRNTIQRDGMSDGNLRFKCRPPVSMSLTCNKSYSESKIRNMIAGVVYGHTLPDPNGLSPSAAAAALAAAAAVNPSNSSAKGRRASHKMDDPSGALNGPESDKGAKIKSEQHQKLMNQDYQQGRQHPLDMGGSDEHRESLSRRPSMQQLRRSSMAAEESMMMDYEDIGSANRRPSVHLQDSRLLKVPGTPPMEGDDHRMYRSHSSQSIHRPQRPPTPTGPVSRPSSGPRLHHSQSHPNIGLHRQQQMDQNDRPHRSGLNGTSGGYHILPYPSPGQPFQSRSLQRQLVRRESSQYPSSSSRFETERRMSHPVVLQSSSSGSLVDDQQGKYLPVGGTPTLANSPALSASSPRSSPGRDHPPLPPHHHAQHSSQQQSSSHLSASGYPNGSEPGMGGTPIARSLSVGRFDEPSIQDFPRRMSQPHVSSHYQSYGSSYDRRASEMDVYSSRGLSRSSSSSKLNKQIPTIPKHPLDHVDDLQRSPILEAGGGLLHASSSSEYIRYGYASSSVSGRRSYESLPDVGAHGGRPSIQYQYSGPESDREDDDGDFSPSYARDGDYEYPPDRIYAKARQGIKRKSFGQSLSRSSSNQNLYSASMRSSGSIGNGAKEVALPNNTIRVTCFPNASSSSLVDGSGAKSVAVTDSPIEQVPSSITLDSTKAMSMNLQQSSKLIIEISPPLRSSASHPNLSSAAALHHISSMGNGGKVTSVLGRRRSVSPDHFGASSSKKRRADDTEMGSAAATSTTTDSIASATAAAVVAAATAASQPTTGSKSGAVVQLIGMDYNAEADSSSSSAMAATSSTTAGIKEGFGLGLGLSASSSASSSAASYHATLESTTAKVGDLSMSSPAIEALSVARAESHLTNAEHDYSKFTRVETANWRILIPPHVVASFQSDNFGLVLRPKDAAPLLEKEEDVCGDSGMIFERIETADQGVVAAASETSSQEVVGIKAAEQHEINITGVHPFDKSCVQAEQQGDKAASTDGGMETDEPTSTQQKADLAMDEDADGEADDDVEEEEKDELEGEEEEAEEADDSEIDHDKQASA